MPNFVIRKFTPQDIPQVTALQQAYQRVHPDATVVPGEVYLSPGFEEGENIFCAFDEDGCLQGYAPLFPVLTDDPRLPHTVWAEVKANPALEAAESVKQLLFERVVQRAREISGAPAGRQARLTFQYFPSETASIEFVTGRGCVYTESVFRMMCDLSEELTGAPPPEQIEVRQWRMESEAEQRAYLQARNEAFPEAPTTLADWQAFLGSASWQDGTSMTAFDGQEVVGSVIAYWDEALSQQIGQKFGFTEYIFVRPGWRKRGIAAYLIYQGLVYLKERGRESAILEVKASNRNALELYERLGYRVVEESRLYVLEL